MGMDSEGKAGPLSRTAYVTPQIYTSGHLEVTPLEGKHNLSIKFHNLPVDLMVLDKRNCFKKFLQRSNCL